MAVFFAPFTPSVVLAGAFEAVAEEAGALPAVEAGLGAIDMCGLEKSEIEVGGGAKKG